MAFSVGVILAVLCLFNRKDQWPGGFALSVEEWALKTFLVIFGIMWRPKQNVEIVINELRDVFLLI